MHKPIDGTFDDVLTAVAHQNRGEVSITAKPFLKWVGGKRSVLSHLFERAKVGFTGKYVEPFVGGGALFFEMQPQNAYISDINFHLIITYTAIRDDVEQVIKHLKQHKNKHGKEHYPKMRNALNTETNPAKVAAIFIYLNKTCFNGLYRVNKQGGFNVPMGSYKNPPILDDGNLRNCSAILQDVDIQQHSFNAVKPTKNTFYYLDPPYHKTYDQYDGSGFGEGEHKALADFCDKIDKAGSYFLLSNSDTPLIRSLYSRYTIDVIQGSRSVSCKAHQRGKENELIVKNY